jgi:hypothetical protein
LQRDDAPFAGAPSRVRITPWACTTPHSVRSCVRDLSQSHAAALLGYNGCALGCRDADCVAHRCRSQARACRAE